VARGAYVAIIMGMIRGVYIAAITGRDRGFM
jgi:hypothetical protein